MRPKPSCNSHLFMVRVWIQGAGDSPPQWGGKIQNPITGEFHYFRGWAMLVDTCLAMLPPVEPRLPDQEPELSDKS
jgi:hypothetical protein